MSRTKLILQPDAVILALVRRDGGAAETLLAALRVPRADFARLLAQAAVLTPGQPGTFYGDGAGLTPGELPLQRSQPNNAS